MELPASPRRRGARALALVVLTGAVLYPPSGEAQARVAFQVQGTRAAPVATPDEYWSPTNGLLRMGAPGVLSNDTDADGGALSAVLVVSPTQGRLQLDADGSFRYNPDPGFTGTDRFTYRASDGVLESEETEVVLTVSTTPDNPRIASPNEGEVLHTRMPVLEGSADPGVEVEVELNGTVVGRATASVRGQWRYPVAEEQALPLGGHHAVAYAVGVAQSRSAPSPGVDFTIGPRELDVTGCGSTGGGPQALGLAGLALLALALAPLRSKRAGRASGH